MTARSIDKCFKNQKFVSNHDYNLNNRQKVRFVEHIQTNKWPRHTNFIQLEHKTHRLYPIEPTINSKRDQRSYFFWNIQKFKKYHIIKESSNKKHVISSYHKSIISSFQGIAIFYCIKAPDSKIISSSRMLKLNHHYHVIVPGLLLRAASPSLNSN